MSKRTVLNNLLVYWRYIPTNILVKKNIMDLDQIINYTIICLKQIIKSLINKINAIYHKGKIAKEKDRLNFWRVF